MKRLFAATVLLMSGCHPAIADEREPFTIIEDKNPAMCEALGRVGPCAFMRALMLRQLQQPGGTCSKPDPCPKKI